MFQSRCGVPAGWIRKVCQRKSGRTAGRYDVYIYSPQGRKFRSRRELTAFLGYIGSGLSISEFNFSAARRECEAGCSDCASPKCLPGPNEAPPREPSAAGDKASTSGVSVTSGISGPLAPLKEHSEEVSARPNVAPSTATAFGKDPDTRDEHAEKAKDVAIDKEMQTGETQVIAAKTDSTPSAVHLLERQPTAGEKMAPEPKDDPGRAIDASRDQPQRPDEADGKPAVENCEPKANPSLAPQQKSFDVKKTSSKEPHRLAKATTSNSKPNAKKKLGLKSKLEARRKDRLIVSSSLFKKFERVPAAKIHSTSEKQRPDAKSEPQPGPSLEGKEEGTSSELSIELEAKPTVEAKQNSEPKKHPCDAPMCDLTAGAQSNLDQVEKPPSTSGGQPPVEKKLKTKKKFALKRKFVEDNVLFTEFHLIKRVPVVKPKGSERK
ncbi:methyl-CpG-binding protein 2-like [Dermacentor albipictus]|uniref:methyl-CpG-binding protein 2-like n=1 Tax=Dermacentor albipictus TaxID=60249 RepID=UPI0031FD016D